MAALKLTKSVKLHETNYDNKWPKLRFNVHFLSLVYCSQSMICDTFTWNYVSRHNAVVLQCTITAKMFYQNLTRGQSNLTKSASRGAHSPVRGHPRGSKVVPLNSWGRVSY